MKFMICVMSSMLKHDIMTDMSLTNNSNQVNQHWRCTKTDIFYYFSQSHSEVPRNPIALLSLQYCIV